MKKANFPRKSDMPFASQDIGQQTLPIQVINGLALDAGNDTIYFNK